MLSKPNIANWVRNVRKQVKRLYLDLSQENSQWGFGKELIAKISYVQSV